MWHNVLVLVVIGTVEFNKCITTLMS